mgnify:CR=1 FL=1
MEEDWNARLSSLLATYKCAGGVERQGVRAIVFSETASTQLSMQQLELYRHEQSMAQIVQLAKNCNADEIVVGDISDSHRFPAFRIRKEKLIGD